MTTFTSAKRRRLALLLERDRRTLELVGLRAARRIGLRARSHAYAALRTGNDPAAAVRAVLWGSQRLGLPGIVGLLTKGMLAAHLAGRRRGLLIAAPRMRAKDKLALAASVYDGALEFLRRRLGLGMLDLAALEAQYQTEALRLTRTISASLERSVQQAVLDVTSAGGGVRDGVRALRQAFDTAGFVPDDDHSLVTLFRTQTQLAYGAGRWAAVQDPAVQDQLWGYQYVTVGDDRVRPNHAEMDGVMQPKDWPGWQRWWPPCGWNCRCSTLECWADEAPEDVVEPPDVAPDPGFAFNPGDVFRDLTPAVVTPAA